MRGNVKVPLDQGFQTESTAGVANSRQPVGKNVNNNSYVSVQTGEEFSSEFIRDRQTPKVCPPGIPMVPNLDKRSGVNNEHDRQMGYEDLTRILGITRVDSECSSDKSNFSSAQGCPPEVDHRNRTDRRCHIDEIGNGQGAREANGVLNSDQANSVARLPPVNVPHSPHSCNPYELGSSEGSQPGKLRILCSFGGKILPRPSDGKLRYVGGETRIISIRKNISWEELVHKTSGICNQPHSIKYQLPGEDLDALISVSSNEDLQNMMEEYSGIEKSAGSQRLRIFLIPASDAESRSSGTLQQASPDYEFVVAVNGIRDPSPRKTSGEQLITELTKSARTYDRIPSFHGDSPSSAHHVEIKESPGSSQGAHVAKEFLNTTMSHVQSPSLSTRPVQHTNAKSAGMPWHEDSFWQNSGESNSSFVNAPLVFDGSCGKPSVHGQESLFQAQQGSEDLITPLTDNNQNHNGGESSLASGRSAHHERYMSQVDSRGFMLGSIDSMDSHHGMTHAYSDSQLQQYDEKSSYCSQEGLSPSSLHCVQSAMTSQALSAPLQDKAVLLPENVHAVIPEVQNQLIDMEPTESCKRVDCPMPLYSDSFSCTPYLENSSKTVNGKYQIGTEDTDKKNPLLHNSPDSNPPGLQMTNRAHNPDSLMHQRNTDQAVLLKNPVEHKLVNDNCYHINTDAQIPQLHQKVALTTVDATLAPKDAPKHQHLERPSSDLVKNHKVAETQQCIGAGGVIVESLGIPAVTIPQPRGPNQEIDLLSGLSGESFVSLGQQAVARPSVVQNIDSQLPKHMKKADVSEGENLLLPENSGHANEKLEKLEHRHGKDVLTTGNEIGRANQSNIHNQNQLEPLLIIEDVSNHTPEVVDFPSAVSPYAVNVFSDAGSEQASVAEEDDIDTEIDSEDSKAAGTHKDDSVIDAVMAEIEAGLYGLQIIKNADLEELKELGSGTYGTVYHGKWRGSDVAIKRIKKSCFSGRSSEQERLTRDFWREAQILSKLHHPNVVAFYGVVPDGAGGTLATVTEFMVNGSLRNVLLKKDRSLDRRRKLIIAMDAAFGMEYLHLKNIVHFDLKCDNLLVNMRDPQRPVCKVGDFGLSRIKRNTLVSGGVRGTLPWMAPELLNGSSTKVSEKVDVFSFGIAMWEILTGEEPYANMHCGAIIGGILKNTLRPPIPERCDPEWRNLMEQCWSSDPDARPSFTEVTNRLRSMSAAVPSRGHTRTLSGGG
ncbi:Serine/threonine-protein kinase EDR1 [Bienertia sinuspersici]